MPQGLRNLAVHVQGHAKTLLVLHSVPFGLFTSVSHALSPQYEACFAIPFRLD